MQRHRHGRDVDAVAFEELALELLEAVAGSVATGTGGHRAATAREHACVVERARQYLNGHFRDSPGLDDIAAAAGAAPAHLCRVFKARLGMPIRGYIHRLRLADALHSATDGATRLDRAAVDAGFYSHSHLTTVCSRVLGSSPREIRGIVLS
jgi:AraC-like DNA-binding protein